MSTYICTACGWEGERKRSVRGSRLIEVLIWSVLLLPGPIYSVWRRTGSSGQCPHCQKPGLIKLNSDEGWLTRRKFDIELGLITPPKEEKKDELNIFGNDRPTAQPTSKKPVDPNEW